MESLTKQQLYRRLMKEQKSKGPDVQKIDHPLAKYNSIGQLTCVICSLPIKSELLWQTHLLSKNHKENVAALKTLPINKKEVTKVTTSSTSDSSIASSNDGEFVKPSLPPLTKRRHSSSSEEAPSLKKSKAAVETSSISKSQGLPTDFFDPPSSELVTDENSNNFNTTSTLSKNSALPDDFFDNVSENTEDSEIKDRDDKNKPLKGQENERELPEGFFDDPKQDAKVRKVEYKDPYDSEWEAFQKSISKESEVSEAIVEEGDEEMKEGRELTEVNEQVHCFQRAENLRVKQESLFAVKHIKKETTSDSEQDITDNSIVIKKERDNDDENGDGDDDADLNDLLNWRFKSS